MATFKLDPVFPLLSNLFVLGWSESTFSEFLSHLLPAFSTFEQSAAQLLYRSLQYHSRFPFPGLEVAAIAAPITRDRLYAGLVMISEHQHKVIGDALWLDGKQVRRSRTESDRRRLLFRSLAHAQEGTHGDEFANRSENAVEHVDENVVDVLDVLSHTQPLTTMLVEVPEEFFRPVMKALPRLSRLQDLRIEHEDLVNLIQLLLIFAQPEDQSRISHRSARDFGEATKVLRSLAAAFSDNGSAVDWERFELVVSNGMVRAPETSNPTRLLLIEQTATTAGGRRQPASALLPSKV